MRPDQSICREQMSAETNPNRAALAVLGLGKLGGEDLNFSSDVDLVYLYRGDGETSGGTHGSVPNVTYYARLAEALRTIVA